MAAFQGQAGLLWLVPVFFAIHNLEEGLTIGRYLPLVAAMIASGYAGTVFGTALLDRMPEAAFRRWFRIALTLLALDMARRGLLALG